MINYVIAGIIAVTMILTAIRYFKRRSKGSGMCIGNCRGCSSKCGQDYNRRT